MVYNMWAIIMVRKDLQNSFNGGTHLIMIVFFILVLITGKHYLAYSEEINADLGKIGSDLFQTIDVRHGK